MELKLNCRNIPQVVQLTVKQLSKTPPKVRIIVQDWNKQNTKYTDRWNTIKGTETFHIRLPMSPKIARITIISMNKAPFKLIKKSKAPLQTQMTAFDFGDPTISKFVIFSQEFACKCGYLSPGVYFNDSGDYEIDYLPTIKDQLKQELNTPARINALYGNVQVSKKIFDQYTIPGRFAILLHEFCHVFANDNMRDEIEADYHAAQIYLALGYPRVELLQVFAKVFLRADNDLNRTRFSKLNEFIMNFNEHVTAIKYN